jgi:hypothetical protein
MSNSARFPIQISRRILSMLKYRWPVRCSFLLFMLAALTAPAMAQNTAQVNEQGGIGIVAGVSAAPDQFYFGVNFMAAKVASNFWFRPGGEIGLWNSRTVVGSMVSLSIWSIFVRAHGAHILAADQALIIDTKHNDHLRRTTTT